MLCMFLKDIKFPAQKRIILEKYHFDTSTICSCILETIYMEDHKLCGMILK